MVSAGAMFVCCVGRRINGHLYLTEGDEREVVGIAYYPTRCHFVSEFDGWVLFQGYQGMEGKMVSKEVYLFTFPFFFGRGGVIVVRGCCISVGLNGFFGVRRSLD